MFGKIQITGTLEIVTGTHIGGSTAFSAIGAVDSPIITDSKTNWPMIPGSSLKGKMRTLLARQYNQTWDKGPNDDDERIIRLFGASKKMEDNRIPAARLLFSDMILSNIDELHANGVQSPTEIKFENSISRLTAVANPRQIERVIRGSKFQLDLVYEASDDKVVQDFETLAQGLKLLMYDYIGGSGSRGYGKVKFYDLHADAVIGDVDSMIIDQCNQILEAVCTE